MIKAVSIYLIAVTVLLLVLVAKADYDMTEAEIRVFNPQHPVTIVKILDCKDSQYVQNQVLLNTAVLPPDVAQFVRNVAAAVLVSVADGVISLEQGYGVMRISLVNLEKGAAEALGYNIALFEESIFQKCENV